MGDWLNECARMTFQLQRVRNSKFSIHPGQCLFFLRFFFGFSFFLGNIEKNALGVGVKIWVGIPRGAARLGIAAGMEGGREWRRGEWGARQTH